jgi:hypothetical protein
MGLARGIAVQPKHLGHLMARLHARWRSWVLARSVKVGRYNLWVDAGNSRNDISRTLRSRNAPMECLRAEGTRDAHHERHTEDTGAEMGNGTRRDETGWSGGHRSARVTTKWGVASQDPSGASGGLLGTGIKDQIMVQIML